MSTGRRLIFRQTGAPADVLEIENFSLEEPGKDQVRVKMLAAAINPADLNTIQGTYGVKPALPATTGSEGYGVVEVSRSEKFQTGDRVIFLYRAGSWASHVTAPASSLFPISEQIAPLQAAMLKVNPATAWQLLHHFAQVTTGDWVVQNAGNSAVARCVIQLAKTMGVRTISFVRRAELMAELKGLGGDAVFPDDETGRAQAKDLLQGANASLAFNAVGGDSALALMKLLREGGTHITYGAMGKRPVSVPNSLLIFRDIQVRGLWVTRWLENAPSSEVSEIYRKLAALVAAGKILQKVDATFAIEDFRKALDRLENPARDGKVLFAFP